MDEFKDIFELLEMARQKPKKLLISTRVLSEAGPDWDPELYGESVTVLIHFSTPLLKTH